MGVDAALDSVIAAYDGAKATHDRIVARGERAEAGQRELPGFALGFLPGLGDVTGMMAPTMSILHDVEVMFQDGVDCEHVATGRRTTRLGERLSINRLWLTASASEPRRPRSRCALRNGG